MKNKTQQTQNAETVEAVHTHTHTHTYLLMKKLPNSANGNIIFNSTNDNIERKSNFELLRIISMIMIVAYHFYVHTEFKFAGNKIFLNEFWLQLISIGGKVGVTVFVFISGYFLISNSKLKLSKLLKLWAQIFFYSITIYSILLILNLAKFEIKTIISTLLPIIFNGWWFASTYFVLYLFSPYINMFLINLDKQTYKNILILMTFCWCIIPTFTTQYFQSNDLVYFVYLYSIAAYIRIWKNDLKIKANIAFGIVVILMIITYLSAILFNVLGLKYSFFVGRELYFYRLQRITTLLISIFLFIGFKNLKIKHSKVINAISSLTFGVYLIHDNNLIRPILWKTIFGAERLQDNALLIPYSVIVILTVYISCTIIELIRKKLIEKYCIKLIEKCEIVINCIINKILELKIIEKL